MHYSEGKTQVTKYTYMDQADKDDLLFLADKGVDVYVQEVPEDKKQSIRDVI
jgi:PTS system galactosamine-specific IIB component